MQRTLHISSPNEHWGGIHGIKGQEKFDKVTLALWKGLGFKLFSTKSRQQKKFDHQKFWPHSNTTLQVQWSNKQTNPASVFVENERQI